MKLSEIWRVEWGNKSKICIWGISGKRGSSTIMLIPSEYWYYKFFVNTNWSQILGKTNVGCKWAKPTNVRDFRPWAWLISFIDVITFIAIYLEGNWLSICVDDTEKYIHVVLIDIGLVRGEFLLNMYTSNLPNNQIKKSCSNQWYEEL